MCYISAWCCCVDVPRREYGRWRCTGLWNEDGADLDAVSAVSYRRLNTMDDCGGGNGAYGEDAGKGNYVSVLIFHYWVEVVELEGEAWLGVEDEVAVCIEDAARVVLGFGIGTTARHYR